MKTNRTKTKKTKKTKTNRKTRKNTPLEKYYESNNGMLTTIWGPPMWHFLHTMSFNYPVEPTQQQKHEYREFILSLEKILPCGKCRKNLKKNFQQLPLLKKHMVTRETFSRYIYELHEIVNRMLKKKSNLTYAQVRERYENFRARCQNVVPTLKARTLETGCVAPIYGIKSKCVLNIIPQDIDCPSLTVDSKCLSQGAKAATKIPV